MARVDVHVVLEHGRIEHARPIVPLVIRWRLQRWIRDSWLIALRDCIASNGRVHSRFHPA